VGGIACHYIQITSHIAVFNKMVILHSVYSVIVLYRLSYCGVTDEGCAALTSALRSNPSHLRLLSLTGNKLEDSDIKLLSDLKNDPHYKLETLYCKWISLQITKYIYL